jgi:hypothetical protein
MSEKNNKYYFCKQQSLSAIILNLSNGVFDPLIEDPEDIFIEHQVDKTLIIRLVVKECNTNFINSTIKILSENNNITKDTEIESDVFDYVVFFYDQNNQILNYSLSDIYMNKDKPSIFSDNLWNLYQLVEDNFEPTIIQEIGDIETNLTQSVENYNTKENG